MTVLVVTGSQASTPPPVTTMAVTMAFFPVLYYHEPKSKSENRCENDLRSGANTPFHPPWCLWWPWPLSSKYFSWKYLLAKKPCAGAARVMIKIKTTAPPRSNMTASSLSPEVDKGSRRRLLPLTDNRCALQHNSRNGASWMSVQFYTLRQ